MCKEDTSAKDEKRSEAMESTGRAVLPDDEEGGAISMETRKAPNNDDACADDDADALLL